MIYRKYIFTEVPDLTEYSADFIGGHPELTPLLLDSEGEVIAEATFDLTRTEVDLLLTEAQAVELKPFEVWPLHPKHYFGGWEQNYKAAYKKRNN